MPAPVPAVIAALAPAKVNLTLHVLGRRADGYHDLESLVAFASFGDRVALDPGAPLGLAVRGPTAVAAGPVADNLVLRAARALAERVDGLRLGRFALSKLLPAGAGLGGGSSDAAAALRLIARLNALDLDDARIRDAARSTGADVPVCLDPKPRLMRGTGDLLSGPLALPALGILIVFPGLAVPTASVFKALGLAPGDQRQAPAPSPPEAWAPALQAPAQPDAVPGRADVGSGHKAQSARCEALWSWLAAGGNDLEAAAIAIAPSIADALAMIAALPGCRLARMSGSGSACFGLFDTASEAKAATSRIAAARPGWWTRAGRLGG